MERFSCRTLRSKYPNREGSRVADDPKKRPNSGVYFVDRKLPNEPNCLTLGRADCRTRARKRALPFSRCTQRQRVLIVDTKLN